MSHPALARQRGATLVEVLIAMLLMSFGVLAMTAMQAHAIQHSQTTDSRARATLLAHDLADRMRANTAPLGDWGAYDLSAAAASAASAAPPSADACQGSAVCSFFGVAIIATLGLSACATYDDELAGINSRLDQLDTRVQGAAQSAESANQSAQQANQRLDQIESRVQKLEAAPGRKPRG